MAADESQRLAAGRNLAPLVFFLNTLLFQVIAFAATIFFRTAAGHILASWISAEWAWTALLIGVDGAVAALLCLCWKMPGSWVLLNAALPAAVLFSFDLPGALMAFALIASALIYVPTFWTRVPYYPTSRRTYDAVAAELPGDREFAFVDLGCGFATMLCHLADRFPNGRFSGVEIGPLPWLVSRARALFRKNLAIRYESLWKVDLTRYDVIYTFLAPGPMEEVWRKVSAEAPKGAVFITNSFPPARQADKTVTVRDRREYTLYIYAL